MKKNIIDTTTNNLIIIENIFKNLHYNGNREPIEKLLNMIDKKISTTLSLVA